MKPLPPELLEELKVDYLASFPEILAEIRVALSQSQWGIVEKHFHRFAGSGKTYGLPDISEVGRAIETYIQKNSSPSQSILEEAVQAFEEIVKAYTGGKIFPITSKSALLKKIA